MRRIFSLFLLALWSCTTAVHAGNQPITFEEIEGWGSPNVDYVGAFRAFMKQCEKGALPDASWQEACDAAIKESTIQHLTPHLAQKARKGFFESEFSAIVSTKEAGEDGFVTGYFIPTIDARLEPDDTYRYPLYALPNDPTRHGREAIDSGALKNKGLEIAWLADPVARFFLHIQGSGLLRLADGSLRQAAFAGTNEKPYLAIGKVLIERGIIPKEEMSYHRLKEWLEAHPGQAEEVMQQNARYVFFKLKAGAEIKGAANVLLTPKHSLAVDPKWLGYGTPVFLSVQNDSAGSVLENMQIDPYYFVIAQDTGAAIRGPARGDIYMGAGEAAERAAGYLQHDAKWVILKPKGATRER